MYDVALHHGSRVEPDGGAMARHGLEAGRFVLATVHRAENTDEPRRLTVILRALERLSEHIVVVWPVHPRTRKALQKLGALPDTLRLIEPVGYLDMVQLERYAALVTTDSGGVQKEAFFHRVPCVTLRDETEWVELIDAGWNRLVPPVDVEQVHCAIRSAIGTRGQEVAPYGRGDAAKRIVQQLMRDL
jgi:UDP-GlcNAc3NAcA epimerase